MVAEAQSPAAAAFDSWAAHGSQPRQDTKLSMQQAFRQHFPAHHLTQIRCTFDIQGFGKAGHAAVTPVNDHGRWSTVTTFCTPNTRLSSDKGRFSDDYLFAHWAVRYKDVDYVYFEMEYEEGEAAVYPKFLLSPRAGQTVAADNHAPLADALIAAVSLWQAESHGEIDVYDSGWHKDEALFGAVASASWADVILDPATKENLVADVRAFFRNRAVYAEFNVPWKRGIILHGTPGNGKTMTIKALLNELGGARAADPVRGLYVKSLKSARGKEAAVASIFAHARSSAPCILVLEDLDSLIADDIRTYFLNEVDGLEHNDGILMLGSTNHLGRLDAAISKRPSRFDRKYRFGLPAARERALYAHYWQRKLAANRSIAFAQDAVDFTVAISADFSFAYMKELFITSLLVTVGDSADQIESVLDEQTAQIDDGDDDEDDDEGEGDDDDGEPAARNLPLPDSLKENKFVVALYKQARVLRREMNSVDEAERKKNSKQKNKGKGGPNSK